MSKLKKGDCVILTLLTGKRVDGYYVGPYKDNLHQVYVNALDGVGEDGKLLYVKKRYALPMENIKPMKSDTDHIFSKQIYEWYDRADILQSRVADAEEELKEFSSLHEKDDDISMEVKQRLLRKIEWFTKKLDAIEKKISDEECQ